MSKTIKVSIVLISIILFYVLSNLFLIKIYGSLYTFVMLPLFWILLAIFTHYFIFDNRKHVFEYKTYLTRLLIPAALIFVVFNFLLGIFVSGFANNPYDNSLEGIMHNFWIFGSVIVAMELVRSSLMNSKIGVNKIAMQFIMVIIFTAVEINFLSLRTEMADIYGIFKFSGLTLVPLLILNSLLTFSANYGGPFPGIYYRMIIYISLWVAPILPDHEWIVTSLLSALIPFLALLLFDHRLKQKELKLSRKTLDKIDPKSWVYRFAVIGIVMLFFLGVTPIYPINIVSNSMYPKIHIGDVVLIKKVEVDEIKLGDIIQYRKEKYSIIHRVTKITKKDGIIFINTKGDNNKDADNTVTTYKTLMGKVIMIVPKVGLPNVWLKDTLNHVDEENAINN